MLNKLRLHASLLGLCLMAAPAMAKAPINDKLPDPDGEPADMSKPVQVFILMGQSNMLEFGKVKGGKDGSLDYAVQQEGLSRSSWTTAVPGRRARMSATSRSWAAAGRARPRSVTTTG